MTRDELKEIYAREGNRQISFYDFSIDYLIEKVNLLQKRLGYIIEYNKAHKLD